MLTEFIAGLKRDPYAVVKVKDFVDCFKATLTPRQRRAYPRWLIIEELSKNFVVGMMREQLHVCGLVLPGMKWEVTEQNHLDMTIV